MRTKVFTVIFGLLATAGLYSQTRLAAPNDPAAEARRGESVIVINAANVEHDMAIWVNDVIAAHVRPKTTEKIIVPDGRNIVQAASTTVRAGQWVIGDKKQVTVDSASNQVTVNLLTRYGRLISVNIQQIIAIGPPEGNDGSAPVRPQAARPANFNSNTLEDAVNRAADTLIADLPDRATLAIISISSGDRDLAEFVIEELAYLMVETRKFRVVDRKSLDAIRSEQNFQYSGDVDDNSAVSIGKMLGASIVITGSVSGSGSTRRLRAKALDVKTAEIVTMASERF
jgi:TolB-like protein